MADSSLKERLRDHAKAFDGLLSLIPSKQYYAAEDGAGASATPKKTKEQIRAAKKGKLDPNSERNRNAKEIMDERARHKRKLLDMQEEDTLNGEDGASHDFFTSCTQEQSGKWPRKNKPADDEKISKRHKTLVESTEKTHSTAEDAQARKQAKRSAKLQKMDEKNAKARKAAISAHVTAKEASSKKKPLEGSGSWEKVGEVEQVEKEPRTDAVDSGVGQKNNNDSPAADSTPTSTPNTPIFDGENHRKSTPEELASTGTSVSSISPTERTKKPIKVPSDITALRARLTAKIQALRAARKADGIDGKPVRTRQELIEQRREKQAQRKTHKKELRRLAKEEEDRKREEALTSSRNSPGSILNSPLFELTGDGEESHNANHFAFGRVVFDDGVEMSHDLSYEKCEKKKRGPTDPTAALLKLEAQRKRLAELDEEKRKDILEKENWLVARRRVEGERVRDDEALLRKAVKRKQKAKKKSEREWKERNQGVENAIWDRQRKREDNLKKRRDDKLVRKFARKEKRSGRKTGLTRKITNRPGFEGSSGFGSKKKL